MVREKIMTGLSVFNVLKWKVVSIGRPSKTWDEFLRKNLDSKQTDRQTMWLGELPLVTMADPCKYRAYFLNDDYYKPFRNNAHMVCLCIIPKAEFIKSSKLPCQCGWMAEICSDDRTGLE